MSPEDTSAISAPDAGELNVIMNHFGQMLTQATGGSWPTSATIALALFASVLAQWARYSGVPRDEFVDKLPEVIATTAELSAAYYDAFAKEEPVQ